MYSDKDQGRRHGLCCRHGTLRDRTVANSDLDQLPEVSIILAVRNENEHLEDCLSALMELDYPRQKLEFLLIDGMSEDSTPDIIARWLKQDERIRSVQNPRRSVACGMNVGIAIAKHDFVLWISGHAILQPQHIRQCLATMNSTGAAAVGGVLSTRGTTAIGRINAAVLSHPFGVGGGAHRVGGRSDWVPVVTMALYRKDAIVAAGGFDESLPRSQDNDLHHRMNKLGHRSYLNVEINPTYLCRNKFRGLLRQAWNNGFWNILLTRRGHGGFSPRHYVPMAFVGGQFVLLMLGFFVDAAWWLLGGAIALYLGCALVVSILIAMRARRYWYAVVLPIWFAALHYTYGVASWAGFLAAKDFGKAGPA